MAEAADELANFMSSNQEEYDRAMAIIGNAISQEASTDDMFTGLVMAIHSYFLHHPQYYKTPGWQITRLVKNLYNAIEAYSECMESSQGNGGE